MLRPAPITAFVGSNGSGKTLTAVAFCVTDHKKTGRPIVANVGGLAVDHYSFDDVEALPDLLGEVGSCNLLIDEAGAMFASRDAGRNKAFQKTVQQLRKYDARLLWTAPAFARADKILREVTFDVILCQPILKVRVSGKAWPSTRLIFQKRFDVARLDTSGMTINKNAKAKGVSIVRTARWQNAFDSFAVAGRPAPAAPVPVE